MAGLDTDFIEKLKAGDQFAFKRLFDEYYARLCVFATKYTQDLDVSKDIVQDLFVKIFQDRNTLNIKTSIRSYLYQAVKNRCLNFIQHERIHSGHMEKIKTIKSTGNPQWKEKMLETELESKIHDLVNSLPAQRQRIFKMSRTEGLKNQQIADKLNISKRTVETQISKALKYLKAGLDSYLRMWIYMVISMNLW